MVALTYHAHREKLKIVGREGDLEEMNRTAVRVANEVAREGGALVAANISNTWSYDPGDAKRTGAIVRAQYEEQLGWAVDEGVDFVIAETNDFLGEALVDSTSATSSACRPWSPSPACSPPARMRLHLCRRLLPRRGRRRGDSRTQLLARAADHDAAATEILAAVDTAVAAQPVPYRTCDATPAFESLTTPDGGQPSRYSSSPSPAHGSKWPTSLAGPAIRHQLPRHLLRRRPAPCTRNGRGPRP